MQFQVDEKDKQKKRSIINLCLHIDFHDSCHYGRISPVVTPIVSEKIVS